MKKTKNVQDILPQLHKLHNKRIVERFSQSNISAVGISGADGKILKATPKYINGKSLGRVKYNIISEFIGAKTMGTVVTRD